MSHITIYLPWNILNLDNPSSSTFSGHILQLFKNSTVKRGCAYKTFGKTDGQRDSYIPHPPPISVCAQNTCITHSFKK